MKRAAPYAPRPRGYHRAVIILRDCAIWNYIDVHCPDCDEVCPVANDMMIYDFVCWFCGARTIENREDNPWIDPRWTRYVPLPKESLPSVRLPAPRPLAPL